MPNLDHVALEVSNMDASIKFYTEKLGFNFVSRAVDNKEEEEYCYLESDGFSLELLLDQRKDHKDKKSISRPFCPHVCFSTKDMKKTIRDLKAKEIQIVHGPLIIEGEATWVYFADLDNNVLEYIQRF